MLINTSNNPLTFIATLLAAIGAINWGLVGLCEFNLVTFLLGVDTVLTKIVYSIVGISGIYILIIAKKFLGSPSIGDVK